MADSSYVTPAQQRGLRACMVCSIVQLQSKFMQYGCPNCENVLQLAGSQDAIVDCTSQVFEGLMSIADPQASWVAKWQRLDGYVPGVYAVKVVGSLPEDVLGTLEDNGIRYIPRDGTSSDLFCADLGAAPPGQEQPRGRRMMQKQTLIAASARKPNT